MMSLTKWRTATTLAIAAGLFLATGTATAQHGRGHGGGHGGYSGGYAPVHHGIYYGHSNWNYVVPHHRTYAGGYYSVGQTHYYTPAPIVSVFSVPRAPAAPLPDVVVQKPAEFSFGGFARYQDLSGRLVMDVNALCLDMHHNYQDNKNFSEVYAEAYNVLQAAKYLQGNDHKGDHDAIGKRVAEVHRQFHHVMDEMRGWTRTANKQVGPNGLEEKSADVEAVLHHLVFDAGIKQEEEHAVGGADLPVVDLGEEAPRPVVKR